MRIVAGIESIHPRINVIVCHAGELVDGCKGWTATEVGLLQETLREYILQQYQTGKFSIVRSSSRDFGGLWDSSVRQMSIADGAYIASPSHGLISQVWPGANGPANFKGTIAHELTHVVQTDHPEVFERWRSAAQDEFDSSDLFAPRDWRVGAFYDWSYYEQYMSDPKLYALLVDRERMAMTTSALMYDYWWNLNLRYSAPGAPTPRRR